MNAIQDRKRELLLESDINRQVLRLECQHVQMQFDQLRSNWLRSAWLWAAPIAGFAFARRMTRPAGFFAKSSAVVSLLTRLWEFWQGRRARPAQV
jgi:hypothetical protein